MTDENDNSAADGGAKGDAPERPGIGKLAAALAKAQGAFANPKRSREVRVRTTKGGEYSFKYADLAAVWDAVRKPLSDNGLAVIQSVMQRGDRLWLRSLLAHESGEYVASDVEAGSINADIKDLGGKITYMRRYCLSALLGIASEEDADENPDGGHVSGGPRRGKAPRQQAEPAGARREQPPPSPKPWDGKPDYKIPYKSDLHVFVRLDPVNGQPLQEDVRKLDQDALSWLDEQLLPGKRGKFHHDHKHTGMVWCCERDRKLVSAEMLRRAEQPEPEQAATGQKDMLEKPTADKNTATTEPPVKPVRVAVAAIHLDAEVDAALVKVTKALSDAEIVALKEISAAEVLAMAVHPANRELFDPAYASELATANVAQAVPLSGLWLARVWYAAHEANKERRLKARKLARLALLALELPGRIKNGPPKIETREAAAREQADVAHLLSGLCGADDAAQRLIDLAKEPTDG